MPDARDTLLLAFDKGLANAPRDGEQWLFLNAQTLPPQGRGRVAQLVCEQGFRPQFLALQQAGYAVQPSVDSGKFGGALMLLTRSRQLNEMLLSRAWDSIVENAVIIAAGENHDGAKSLRKHVARHCGEPQSLSKHHALAFSFKRSGETNPFAPQTRPRRGGHEIAPGMFSADGPDEGSKMLARHFDDRIGGDIADFGAGWGYLGCELLQAAPRVDRLDCIEADHASLAAARKNLANLSGEAEFHWLDLTSEAAPADYDWVVMNPPFHHGRAATPALGATFIKAAAKALRPDGHLLMVANRNLPYEAVLSENFAATKVREENALYKVLEAANTK